MKKTATVLILVATLLFATNAMAQVQLGVQGGINLGNVNFDPDIEGLSTGNRTGVMFGGVLFYSFSPILGLQIEPAYVQVGTEMTVLGIDVGTVKGNFLEIPVMLKASFGEGPIKPFIMVGPAVGFKLGDVKWEYQGMSYTVQAKSTNFMLSFGGGVIIPVDHVNIFIEGLYNLGLTDVNDDDPEFTDIKIKTTGIQAKAGVLFPL